MRFLRLSMILLVWIGGVARNTSVASSEVPLPDGEYLIGVASGLEKIFLDEPYRGSLAASLEIAVARNESEGAQIVIISHGDPIKAVTVRLEGDLKGSGGEVIPSDQIKIELVGYVDTSQGDRPYKSSKLGWWPDPLLPNSGFDVNPGECQPLLVTVTTTEKTTPDNYVGTLRIASSGKNVSLPFHVKVYAFALPSKGHFRSFSLGADPEVVAGFYGGDPGKNIAERFALEAAKHRLPPAAMLNGWGWKTAKAPRQGEGYDFTELDRWIDLLGPYLTRFPMAVVPRFRKFGGGEYNQRFQLEFAAFVKAYAAHLKTKRIYDAAVLYNIDEASNDPQLREWEVCREMYALAKAAAPDLPVMQCLNESKGVEALTGHADIWDLYFRQYEKAGGPGRMKAGDEIALSVCIWPAEHPNLFIEYPLLDARIMPWICFKLGVKGFEYWDLYQTWEGNRDHPRWLGSGQGSRTAWKLDKPHGDGLLLYPGPNGTPLSSLRLEALRDGIEDYEYLILLSKSEDRAAAELLKEAKETLITGVTSYNSDPSQLLDLRARIADVLEREKHQQ